LKPLFRQVCFLSGSSIRFLSGLRAKPAAGGQNIQKNALLFVQE